MNWKQSLEHQQSVASAFATLAAVFDPFTERLSGWMTGEELSDNAGTQSKRWHLLTKQTRQESEEEKKTVQWLL